MKGLFAIALAACAAPTWQPPATARPVVLVTLDGVRREDALANLPVEDAVVIDDLTASGSNHESIPGYLEIVTGRPAIRCESNHCGRASEPTLLDELAKAGAEVALVGSWDWLERAASVDPERLPMTVGRSNGALRERFRGWALAEGAAADAFPGLDDYRPDRYTEAIALEYLASARPWLLWIALGDTDEYAHRGDVAGYRTALRETSRFLAQLRATLDAMGDPWREALLVVTTDHGRGPDFVHHGADASSGRTWALMFGRATISLGGRRLCNLAPLLRRELSLPADRSADACE